MSAGDPFPCAGCGATDAWKADYYEAVWQSCAVVADADGRPDVVDYDGAYETYEVPTENERLVCQKCGHEIRLAEFRLTPVDQAAAERRVLEAARVLVAAWDGTFPRVADLDEALRANAEESA